MNFSKLKSRKPYSTMLKAFLHHHNLGVLDTGENMMFSSLLVLKNKCIPNVKLVSFNEIIDDITLWRQRVTNQNLRIYV